jgi:pimeloyl-ACP methyl ester carboxylesterase
VVWAAEDRVMPPEHGRGLAQLLPDARLIEVEDTYTLIPEDQPGPRAAAISRVRQGDGAHIRLVSGRGGA